MWCWVPSMVYIHEENKTIRIPNNAHTLAHSWFGQRYIRSIVRKLTEREYKCCSGSIVFEWIYLCELTFTSTLWLHSVANKQTNKEPTQNARTHTHTLCIYCKQISKVLGRMPMRFAQKFHRTHKELRRSGQIVQRSVLKRFNQKISAHDHGSADSVVKCGSHQQRFIFILYANRHKRTYI